MSYKPITDKNSIRHAVIRELRNWLKGVPDHGALCPCVLCDARDLLMRLERGDGKVERGHQAL